MRFPHTIRRLLQQRVFTAVTILTLAIGIGANSAIFAVLEGVLFKPLPYPQSQQLVDMDHAAPGVGLDHAGSAPFLYLTYQAEARTFQKVGLWRRDTDSLTGLGEPEEIPTLDVTEGVLEALSAQPLLGRLFTKSDTAPGSPETVVASYGFWRSKMGGESSAIGRNIILDGRARQLVGVLPQGFRFLDLNPSLIIPLHIDPAKTFLGNFSYSSIARLNPGVTLAQANSDAARIIQIAMHRFPPFPGYSMKMFEEARLIPVLQPLKQSLLGDVGKVLWVLMGTVGMVLLIACANVANLMLVRAQSRQHELAIRAALGAGAWQVARELLAESVVLGILGGAAGLGLASGALRLLAALAPANLPRLNEISMDGPVLLFTFGISLFAGVLFGLIPAVKFASPHVTMSLRAGGRTMSDGRDRQRARATLVVVQVGLALVLLISSGLMIRTFQALRRVDPGFAHPERLQSFGLYIPSSAVKEPLAVLRMTQDILDRVKEVPGVSSAGITTLVPMTGSGWHDPIFAEDHVYAESQIPPLRAFKFVSPGLISTMGNPLVAGRDFAWTDITEKRNLAMVSENTARELWGSPQAAIGKRIRENLKGQWREIVGVVGDEREEGVDHKAPTVVFFPLYMSDFDGDTPFITRGFTIVVRSNRTGSSGFVGDLSRAVWSVNPNLPLASVRTMREVYDKSLARTSFALVMLAIAGATALLLGIAGIYGVISYAVSQRTREIGIRRALGSQNAQITAMFLRQAAQLTAIGIACGLGVALGVTRLMSSLLFDVKPADPFTFIIVTLVLAASALAAGYIPALRATGIDPIEALRAE
jgi:predicted permease